MAAALPVVAQAAAGSYCCGLSSGHEHRNEKKKMDSLKTQNRLSPGN